MTPEEIALRQKTISDARRKRSEKFRVLRNAVIRGDWDEYDRILNAEYAAAQGSLGDGAGEAASSGEVNRGGVDTPGNEA